MIELSDGAALAPGRPGHGCFATDSQGHRAPGVLHLRLYFPSSPFFGQRINSACAPRSSLLTPARRVEKARGNELGLAALFVVLGAARRSWPLLPAPGTSGLRRHIAARCRCKAIYSPHPPSLRRPSPGASRRAPSFSQPAAAAEPQGKPPLWGRTAPGEQLSAYSAAGRPHGSSCGCCWRRTAGPGPPAEPGSCRGIFADPFLQGPLPSPLAPGLRAQDRG